MLDLPVSSVVAFWGLLQRLPVWLPKLQ